MDVSRLGFVVAAAFVLSSCQNGASVTDASVSKYDVNKYAVNKTVCNPLGGSQTPVTEPSQGLQATLWYLEAGQPIQHNVESMISTGHQSDENLFFSEIFVPTRLFTEGFPQQSGGSIVDDSGDPLIEYFALRFEGSLHLGPNEAEGDYQLGILADDGVIMYLSQQSDGINYQPVLNNDGDHPTQMGCGPTIHMTKDTNLPMRIDYYQGPRYEIALVPMWRLVNSCTVAETMCGQSGNSLYFDPNNNSRPEQAYNNMMARGWYPLSSQNYSLLESAAYNPCTQGQAPQITNVTVTNDSEQGFFLLNWTTDIPATDQVLVTDTGTNIQTLTTSDNIMRTTHSVPVTGLLPGTNYTLQAVSVGADLGKSISAPVTVSYQ